MSTTHEMITNINISHKIKIEALTPVYVGASKDRQLIQGIDYFDQDKQVFFVDKLKLYEQFEGKGVSFDQYSNFIATGNTKRLKEYLFDDLDIYPEEISSKVLDSSIALGNEINTMIRTGQGVPYIPGSSIKGAIRSILFHHLKKQVKVGQEWDKRKNEFVDPRANTLEKETIGSFEKSITRFLRVYDAHFREEDLALMNVNLFNLYNHGRWESKFKKGFKLSIEALKPNSNPSEYTLNIASPLIEYIRREQEDLLPTHIDKVIKDHPFQYLFYLINEYTYTHIERELEFFKTYDQVEGIGEIIECLERLQGLTNAHPNQCVLRLASGSGFHGITGDWRFDDHTETIDYPDNKNIRWVRKRGNRDKTKEGTRYKSRKIIDYDKAYMPMGFVLLSLPEEVLVVEFPKQRKIKLDSGETPFVSETNQEQVNRDHVFKDSTKDEYFTELDEIIDNKTVFQACVIHIKPLRVQLHIQGREWEANLSMGVYKKMYQPNEGDLVNVIAKQRKKTGEIIQVSFQP